MITMKFDDIFTYIGEYGRYQKQVSLVLCVVIIGNAFHNIGTVFFNGHMDHHCKLPAVVVNDSVNCNLPTDGCEETNLPPDDEETLLINETQCRMYAIDDNARASNDTELVRCEYGWVYDRSFYDSTIVSQFDLVCEDSYKVSLSSSCYLAGFFLGSILFGWMGDHFGRKIAILIAILLGILSGILCAVSPFYWFYVVARFINGSTSIGIYIVVYVYVAEFVAPSKRAILVTIAYLYWSVGYMLLAVIAYFIRSWRTLLFVLSLIPTPLLIVYYLFIPESARWLLSKKRNSEAKAVLQKIVNGNNTTLPEDVFDRLMVEEETDNTHQKKANRLDLIRSPILRMYTLNLVYSWFTVSLVYYALAFGVEGLPINVYIGTFLGGVIEMCSCLFGWVIIQKFGRPWTLGGSLIIGGTMCFINIWIPSELEALRTAIAMAGKFFITTAFVIVYIVTVEIYPTDIRSSGLGLCSFMSRIGGVLAPQILFLEKLWKYLPLVMYSSLSISAGLLALFLPETLNEPLPQTIEETAALRRKSKPKPRTGVAEFNELRNKSIET